MAGRLITSIPKGGKKESQVEIPNDFPGLKISRRGFILGGIGLLALVTLWDSGLIQLGDWGNDDNEKRNRMAIFKKYKSDPLLYQHIEHLVEPGTPYSELRKMDGFLSDIKLKPSTARAIVAASQLKLFPDEVTGSVEGVNDGVGVIVKHMQQNSGMPDPSNFDSMLDYMRLMYFRGIPARKQLSDQHINTTVMAADISYRCLPKIGDWPNWLLTSTVPTDKWRDVAAYAPYSQTACNDPREPEVRFAPYSNENDWVKHMTFAPTGAESSLLALKNGRTDQTMHFPSYTPKERELDVNEMQWLLENRGDMIDSAPIEMRPYTYFTGSLSSIWSSSGSYDNSVSERLDVDQSFRNFEEITGRPLPNPNDILYYITGMQYVVRGDVPAQESFGIMVVKDSARDSRGNYTPPFPYEAYWRIAKNGTLYTLGEPVHIPSDTFPFYDEAATANYWMSYPYSIGTDIYRDGKVYGKSFRLNPVKIDEGNPWELIIDTTVRL